VIKSLKFLLLIIVISSCSQKRAPVLDYGSKIYDRGYFKNNYKNYSRRSSYTGKKPNWIKVKKGETIYGISREYDVPIRDLISRNNLSTPYILYVGQKIILPKGNYHIVKRQDTLYGISRIYGMNVSTLVALNDLPYPYKIRVGQKLRISQNGSIDSKSKSKPAKYQSSPKEIKVANKNNKFIKPVKGRIISSFGPKTGGLYNDGINITAPKGTKVAATEDGVVAYVGDELRGYGNLIIVKHSDGWISAYGHLDKTMVKRGDKIIKNQRIATVGSTGNVKSSQLYFGLRKGRKAVNPASYL
jgi:murein DD-endopeptidase MepM/ murein hydrolase activator NlpD